MVDDELFYVDKHSILSVTYLQIYLRSLKSAKSKKQNILLRICRYMKPRDLNFSIQLTNLQEEKIEIYVRYFLDLAGFYI